MKTETFTITPEIITLFVEKRIAMKQLSATVDVQAMLRHMSDDMVIRLRSYMLDRMVWHQTISHAPVIASGIWNGIKDKLPFWLALKLGGVKTVDTINELHVHHNCPHMRIDSEGVHLQWLEGETK